MKILAVTLRATPSRRMQLRIDAMRAAGHEVVVREAGGALLGYAFNTVSFDELDNFGPREFDWLAHVATKLLPKP